MNVDFSSYEPKTGIQKEFHASKSKHKLLIGGYRAGKTYPAIHEALFICFDNPGHEFAVFRDTWEVLRDNIEKDFVELAYKYNASSPSEYDATNHNLMLACGTLVKFRPLSLERAKLKGLSICGFLIDDPNVSKYRETISFLYSRLTNKAGRPEARYFATIICANYEGHDWLWKTFMRRKEPGGDDQFAYWWCKTEDNPTLQPDYIETQARIHSKSWMDRYIYCKPDSHSGLVYEEYSPKEHDFDLSWVYNDNSLFKILVIDLGITHPSVILSIAVDLREKEVLVYSEWHKTNVRTYQVGEQILEKMARENINLILIDPKSQARDQTSGISPRQVLYRDFRIRTKLANNSELFGIEKVKSVLTKRDGISKFKIDPSGCPILIKQLESLMWKETLFSDFDEVGYKEKPVDIDNDCTDCLRYGVVETDRRFKILRSDQIIKRLEKKRQEHREEKRRKLPLYKSKPELGNRHRDTEADRLRRLHEAGIRRMQLESQKERLNG